MVWILLQSESLDTRIKRTTVLTLAVSVGNAANSLTAGNVNDVVEANSLLHGEEADAFGDAGYQGADKRPDAKPEVKWHIAMRPGRRSALDLSSPLAAMIDKSQQILAGIRAKVEHPFRVIKRQFGFTKVRYRGLKKNAAQVQTLFALSNLWMARRKLMAGAA